MPKTTSPFNESYYLSTADLVNDHDKVNNMIGSSAAYRDSWIRFTSLIPYAPRIKVAKPAIMLMIIDMDRLDL
jgi:hypothetical protein